MDTATIVVLSIALLILAGLGVFVVMRVMDPDAKKKKEAQAALDKKHQTTPPATPDKKNGDDPSWWKWLRRNFMYPILVVAIVLAVIAWIVGQWQSPTVKEVVLWGQDNWLWMLLVWSLVSVATAFLMKKNEGGRKAVVWGVGAWVFGILAFAPLVVAINGNEDDIAAGGGCTPSYGWDVRDCFVDDDAWSDWVKMDLDLTKLDFAKLNLQVCVSGNVRADWKGQGSQYAVRMRAQDGEGPRNGKIWANEGPCPDKVPNQRNS